MVPHISEELWRILGHEKLLLKTAWPKWDDQALKAEEMLIVVQINGKLRSRITVPADATDEELENISLKDSRIRDFIEGKQVRKSGRCAKEVDKYCRLGATDCGPRIFPKFQVQQCGVLAMVGRNLKVILLISSMLFCLASCGYHFSGEGQGPKPGLRCIAIPVFENKTTEPNAGAIFAGALRQEFMRKGKMRVVPVENAEAVFKGTIKSIMDAAGCT